MKQTRENRDSLLSLVTMFNTLLDAAAANTGVGGSAYFFGWMGCASALIFTNFGSAYGTAKAGVGLMSMGVMNPGEVMKNTLPIVMAGILGIYGLIVSIILSSKSKFPAGLPLSQTSLLFVDVFY